ncbi:adenylate kinase [Gracilaria domingensis]|nr:adenylate kinase [Gracilaria domingensis]
MFWGPPGSGKSTLCEALSQTHGLVHISTGSLLRAHVLYETELGIRARPYVQKSTPAPDEIVIPMVLERLGHVDCRKRGYLLDGFPRNVDQLNALNRAGFHYRIAFMLQATRDTLERRIRYRRLDPETDSLYNLKLRPADSQEVLERLVILDKDRAANVPELFASYGRTTAEMFELLSPRSVRMDADRAFDDVLEDISSHIERCGVRRLHKKPRLRSRVAPLVATPPDLLGRANAVREHKVGDRPASAAAAMRAMKATTTNEQSVPSSKKTPITLVRCDGYMCERETVADSHIAFRGAATEQVMLLWNQRPRTILLLVKKDPSLIGSVLEAARHLIEIENLKVIVEPQVQTRAIANGLFLDTFASSETLHQKVDLVLCLGGDGLILHVCTLFKTAVPPVVSFNLGSLGFLTPFQFEDFQAEIAAILKGDCNLSLRMRLTCGIIRNGYVEQEFQVLNEVVVDRGASPYLSNLDCYCDGKYITTVQADGIIMSTPTGSTAYSMSAGGSMVHPSVPAILFTPICPHSLSFRPIVFPDSAKLRIEISEDARSHAWASFDGKSRQQLRRGDGLLVEMNLFPVPTVNKTDHTGDWFQSLDRAFNFNSRAMQKPVSRKRLLRPPVKGNGAENAKASSKGTKEKDNGVSHPDAKDGVEPPPDGNER